ncbi:MAG: carboxypeptidase-like regulatory domain-containing protein [bacterium]|nr:carboxypeptidase-like regulatory domain-containing protein [bacterium]
MNRYFKLISISILLALTSVSVLAQSGGVKGKVRANNGSGIANATVTARQFGKDIKTVRSDSKGVFQLAGLETGVYSLLFDADGYQSGLLQGVEVKGGNVRDLGERLILRPDQGNLIIVNGSIFYKEGTSLGGAKVEVELVNADGSTKRLTTLYTTIQGEFTYKRPEGAAKLRFKAKFKGAEGVKEVDVDTAAVYRFALTLDVSRTEK